MEFVIVSDFSDLDYRRTFDLRKTRMSSLLHEKHSVCVVCRGFDCSLDKRCNECESLPEDLMCKYLKHQKSLESKIRSCNAKKLLVGKLDPGSHSASPIDSYSPQSIKGRALEEEIRALRRKGAVEPASSSPCFYSLMFVVTKASGGWRLIIDLSTLNLSVDRTPFRMETAQTVLCSVRRNDWMVFIDLKDVYLQILIHPASRRFLRFTAGPGSFGFFVSGCPRRRRCLLA